MADEFLLGMNAKIFLGTTGAALSAMTEMTNVKDVTLNLTAGEADVTTRANSGWKATAATLKECSVEFAMQWKPSDTQFEDIRDAFLAGTYVELAVLTGDKSGSDSEGPKGSFTITGFSRKEPLEESVSVDVTAKLAVYDEWIEAGVEGS